MNIGGDSMELSDSDGDRPEQPKSAVPSASQVAWRESRQARYMRAIVFLFLMAATVTSCLITYFVAKQHNEENFEIQFESDAYGFGNDLQLHIENKFVTSEELRVSITSYVTSQSNANWPFVTVPDYAVRAGSSRSQSGAISANLIPLVVDGDRAEWEEYTKSNLEWIGEAEEFEADLQANVLRSLQQAPEMVNGVATEIFKFDKEGEMVVSETKDIYFPVWQTSPLAKEDVNLDRSSEDSLYMEVARSEKAYVGPILEANKDVQVSKMYLPIWNTIEQADAGAMMSILSISFTWDECFKYAMSNGMGATVVLTNDCDQVYSWSLSGGDVEFLGQGDQHDPTFSSWGRSFPVFLEERLQDVVKNYHGSMLHDICKYKMTIYPTQEFVESSSTGFPILITCLLLIFVIPVACAFCAYEGAAERRYDQLVNNTNQADAIVASMFPAAVQERLFNEANKDGNDDEKPLNLKSIADNNRISLSTAAIAAAEFGGKVEHSIADSFPNTTILFADIVGFTPWSSQREPGEVFQLLQTVYHSFDMTARKHGVFKVETVGDCYVAATGLPEPQPDHAVRMAKFAREIMGQMGNMTRELELTLGPDTFDLKLRIGMNSGPLTGGVLRGEKARFQLFGDTMNMAARMESTGRRKCIQMSQSTYDLIVSAGKMNWVEPREDLVQVKGKGEVSTYWLKASSGVSAEDDEELLADEALLPSHGKEPWQYTKLVFDLPGKGDRYQRLVDWNVEVLAQLLREIAGTRREATRTGIPFRKASNAVPTLEAQGGSSARDEVREFITLPSYEPKAEKAKTNTVELDPVVIIQLRDYVTTIASMYRNNSFHNFEHASHVTMSTNKLLKRIVQPHLHTHEQDKILSTMELHSYSYGIATDPLTQFALLFCSLIHDCDHAGVSNFQLIAENSTLARIYKNQSIAEQNSVDLAWDLLMDPNYEDLQKAIYSDHSELKRFRQLVVNIVLATDIFDKDMKNIRDTRWGKAFQYGFGAESDEPQPQEEKIGDFESRHPLVQELDGMNMKATVVLEHLIQASDVAHTMQHWDIYLKWNERLFCEMYAAYDAGRMGKCPADNWYEGEIMFFDKYIIPLAKKLDECGVFGVSSDEYLSYAQANRKQWAVQGDKIVEEFAKKYQEKKLQINKRASHTGATLVA